MPPITQQLYDRFEEKHARTPAYLFDSLPEYKTLTQQTIVGVYSYYLMRDRYRILARPLCIPLGEMLETPPAVARTYLQIKYRRRPPVMKPQIERLKDSPRKAPPQFVKPATFHDGYYVDISAAYWSILNVCGWNLDYYPNHWLGQGEPPADFPFPDHKVARTCLVSCAQSNEQSVYVPWPTDDIEYRNRGNALSNLGLWRLVLDVLHSIAAEAIRCGAVYWNNDGCIAPSLKTRMAVERVIEAWGLMHSIKYHGQGQTLSSGTFEIGGHKSGHTRYRCEPVALNTVSEPEYRQWLQKRFTHFA